MPVSYKFNPQPYNNIIQKNGGVGTNFITGPHAHLTLTCLICLQDRNYLNTNVVVTEFFLYVWKFESCYAFLKRKVLFANTCISYMFFFQ